MVLVGGDENIKNKELTPKSPLKRKFLLKNIYGGGFMQGSDVYSVLQSIRATKLYHANSVTTSRTFFKQGGLLSRCFVENHKLSQTRQGSDLIDKRYGIWDRIFVDHVDIHYRGGRKKGPNQYGPVLFVFDLDILLGLPEGSEVCVTKMNPIYWRDNQSNNERWFESVEKLAENIRLGDYDKMLVIQTPSGKLVFPNRRARILLDDPQRQISLGENAYTYAESRLNSAAAAGQIKASIEPHECCSGCICTEKYARYSPGDIDFWFT